jgi:hypothetical protein
MQSATPVFPRERFLGALAMRERRWPIVGDDDGYRVWLDAEARQPAIRANCTESSPGRHDRMMRRHRHLERSRPTDHPSRSALSFR